MGNRSLAVVRMVGLNRRLPPALKRRLFTGVCVLAFIVAACGSGSDVRTVTAAGIPLQSLSKFQQEIFADGEVTFSEYESAMIATVECLLEAGVPAKGPILESNNTYSFITSTPQGMTDEQMIAHVQKCEDEYSSVVQLGWADTLAPSAEEEREFYEGVATCLNRRGIPVESARPDVLAAARGSNPEIYDSCFREALDADPSS